MPAKAVSSPLENIPKELVGSSPIVNLNVFIKDLTKNFNEVIL